VTRGTDGYRMPSGRTLGRSAMEPLLFEVA
jgi:hypothetical protein